MDIIPTYALYGEQAAIDDWLHWETLVARSRPHRFNISPHRHEGLFQIIHLKSGEAEVTLDGGLQTISGPALVVVPALTVHGFVFSNNVDGIVLTLFERDVRAAFAGSPDIQAALRQPLILRSAPSLETIGHEIRVLTQEADWRSPARAAALRARISLVLVGIYRAFHDMNSKDDRTPDRATSIIRAFSEMVDRDFRQHHPVGYYAGALGITAQHLNRICRSVLNSSASQVIEKRLLLEARRHLMFTGFSVKEIAIGLGFSDPAYFSRVFSRGVGQSPTRYREKSRVSANQEPCSK
ncbi:MAG: helix-turn-helix domain-containing protein [Rhizobiaceae bacterium]|nr:helix-turn-helix domain-containing protein [Rhizobiaceae bacterium]